MRVENLCLFDFQLDGTAPVDRREGPVEVLFPEKSTGIPSSLFRWIPREIAESRLERENGLVAAVEGEEVLSYCWTAYSETGVHEIDASVIPLKDELYIYDAFTRPRARGRRLFPLLLSAVLKKAASQGYGRLLIFVSKGNQPSLSAVSSVGFQRFQEVSYVSLPPFRFYWMRRRGARPARLSPSGGTQIAGGLDRTFGLLAAGESRLSRGIKRLQRVSSITRGIA